MSSKNNNVKKSKSMVARLWVIMITIMIIIIATFAVSFYSISLKTKRDTEIRESQTVISTLSSSIQANIESYIDISRLVMLNEDVITYLRADTVDAGMTNDCRLGVMEVLYACRNVDSVMIFRNDSFYMNTGKGEYSIDYDMMKKYDWERIISEKRGGAVVSMNGNDAIYKKKGPQVITVSREIYDIYSQKKSGILMLNISLDMLNRILSVKDYQEACILTNQGDYLAGNKELVEYFSNNYISDTIVNAEINSDVGNKMISGCKISGTPLIVLCQTSADKGTVPTELIKIMLVLLGAFILSLLMAGIFIAKNITSPIILLSQGIQKTKESGYLKKVEAKIPNNEIGLLLDSYNSLIEYLNELIDKLIDKEKVAQRAQIRVLHEQIKPHFLYNSLETITYLAVEAGADKVQSALETLGSFYRNFLSKGDKEIPFRREISIIKDYLSLQKLRYKDIIIDEYDIDDNTLDCMIPKLLLQPLVENSIYHGIRLKGEEGIIKITGYIEDEHLIIKVYDSGVGMSESDIEHILESGESELSNDDNPNKSFGLKGTIERIRFYCDNKDAVSIKSELGEYTEIEIRIPLIKE